ncbi:MAG: hypothetical protein H7A23_04635 [Leptospiraceae bacterium]|nr:hypothetical protein [Leptospiraceae bacterium]MCP5493821.1 hypothetical protein [Leptospiraceae bacterium]
MDISFLKGAQTMDERSNFITSLVGEEIIKIHEIKDEVPDTPGVYSWWWLGTSILLERIETTQLSYQDVKVLFAREEFETYQSSIKSARILWEERGFLESNRIPLYVDRGGVDGKASLKDKLLQDVSFIIQNRSRKWFFYLLDYYFPEFLEDGFLPLEFWEENLGFSFQTASKRDILFYSLKECTIGYLQPLFNTEWDIKEEFT